MRSQVAGLSIWKVLVSPASSRDAFMASWMAKNTDAARNNGGSPTACKGYSELPLIRTPEMWPPLYSGHSEKYAL